MGRPLRKDVLGTDAIGTPLSTATGIRVEAYIGQAYTDATYNITTDYAYIVKQRGAKTFVVANQAGTKAVCVLQSAIPSATGHMRINGYIGGNGSVPTPIAKITKRVATDFTGKRYTWILLNDSTSDYIALTAT
jgi:GR25 family glycosyltransferase involved in LPS biosynthesis